jgi:hypothetical protein
LIVPLKLSVGLKARKTAICGRGSERLRLIIWRSRRLAATNQLVTRMGEREFEPGIRSRPGRPLAPSQACVQPTSAIEIAGT